MNSQLKLVLTGGGTAGHIMPCVAIIEQFLDIAEIHYIGSHNGMEREIISKIKGVEYHAITTVKLIRAITLKNLAIPFKLMAGIIQAKKILNKIKPDVIFSKGGFVALPVTLASKYPIICHESDLSMGISNRLVAHKAKYVCSSFPSTTKNLKNGFFTGCPVRHSLYKAKQHSARPLLLIMGGSLGAKAINDCIASSIDLLTQRFDIVHITGKGKQLNIKKEHYTQMEFCDDIGSLYSKADIVLTRGGGTALFELAALQIPSLVIPLPKGISRGDQIQNAKYFEKLGLCRVLEQEKLTPQNLIKELDLVFTSQEIRKNLRLIQNIDGTKKICELILKVAQNKKADN